MVFAMVDYDKLLEKSVKRVLKRKEKEKKKALREWRKYIYKLLKN